MEHNKNGENNKKPYEKPRIRIIELAAEEVLAPSCKTLGGGGSLPVAIPCNATGCSGIGS
ncbi:MAG: hypothetical protein AB1632_12355 [Nitrospirota bacterium]